MDRLMMKIEMQARYKPYLVITGMNLNTPAMHTNNTTKQAYITTLTACGKGWCMWD
jgi:hypothetical protein